MKSEGDSLCPFDWEKNHIALPLMLDYGYLAPEMNRDVTLYKFKQFFRGK